MKTIEDYGTFEDALANAAVPVQTLARRLREIIIDIYPEVVEVPWPHQGNIGYGVGPKKMSEHFCYIGLQRERVNLGFFYGAGLPDPRGLLEGSGAKLRHVKVRSLEAAEDPALHALLQAALNERRRVLGMM